MKRVAIYPKDIMIITGKSERYSRNILNQIKTKLNKEKQQIVTINELCDFLGIKENDLPKQMNS